MLGLTQTSQAQHSFGLKAGVGLNRNLEVCTANGISFGENSCFPHSKYKFGAAAIPSFYNEFQLTEKRNFGMGVGYSYREQNVDSAFFVYQDFSYHTLNFQIYFNKHRGSRFLTETGIQSQFILNNNTHRQCAFGLFAGLKFRLPPKFALFATVFSDITPYRVEFYTLNYYNYGCIVGLTYTIFEYGRSTPKR